MLLLNVACVWLSWHVANKYCDEYSPGWWFNMTASALNAVIVLRNIT